MPHRAFGVTKITTIQSGATTMITKLSRLHHCSALGVTYEPSSNCAF